MTETLVFLLTRLCEARQNHFGIHWILMRFLLTRLCEARRAGRANVSMGYGNFYSRASARRDDVFSQGWNDMDISTHAPLRGATRVVPYY